MTYNDAYMRLPIEAKWSCSFGYPGTPGYVEYWRAPDKRRWNICNGTHESEKDEWRINQIGDAP